MISDKISSELNHIKDKLKLDHALYVTNDFSFHLTQYYGNSVLAKLSDNNPIEVRNGFIYYDFEYLFLLRDNILIEPFIINLISLNSEIKCDNFNIDRININKERIFKDITGVDLSNDYQFISVELSYNEPIFLNPNCILEMCDENC